MELSQRSESSHACMGTTLLLKMPFLAFSGITRNNKARREDQRGIDWLRSKLAHANLRQILRFQSHPNLGRPCPFIVDLNTESF